MTFPHYFSTSLNGDKPQLRPLQAQICANDTLYNFTCDYTLLDTVVVVNTTAQGCDSITTTITVLDQAANCSPLKVAYGSGPLQFLDIHTAPSNCPTPVFIYAHQNGGNTSLPNSMVNSLTSNGISIVSWESVPDLKNFTEVNNGWTDAELMLAWVKANADTYNFDTTQFIVGASSRGSILSWKFAHRPDPNIKGIYMYNALPDGIWADPTLWYPPNEVNVSSPPIFLVYGPPPGTTTDSHDPNNGFIIIDRYNSLGIGDRDTLIHSISSSGNSDKFQFLLDFALPLVDTSCSSCSPTACDDGDVCTINDVYDSNCNCAGTPINNGLLLEEGMVVVSGDNWSTVTLDNAYCSMVVVATPQIESISDAPVVTRIRNATGSLFEVRLQNPGGSVSGNYNVQYLVAEEGTYTATNDGVTMEVRTLNSTQTAGKNAWVFENRTYLNTYTNPVVLGQVMTYNDADWSTFWASANNSRVNPPNASGFAAGKQVAEDTDKTRANETLGVIVVEAGNYQVSGLQIDAGLGADDVRGTQNSASGYDYTTNLSNVSNAVLSVAAFDGGDAGWPVLFTNAPFTNSNITLAFDEDQFVDSERSHTTEQVAYLAVSASCAMVGTPCDDGDANTVNDIYNNNCVCEGTPLTCNITIISDDFESGFGNWNDGGTDCQRLNNTSYASTGNYSVELRDNTSTSTMTTGTLDLSNFTEITVDFGYYPRSMDNSNEDFWLQISSDDGTTFTTVEEWNESDEFVNDQLYTDQVVIQGPFTSNTQLRFRSDASGDWDFVYIDDVSITGCQVGSGAANKNEESPDDKSNDAEKIDFKFNSPSEMADINIYPNPFNRSLHIAIEKNMFDEIQVFDLNGKLVLKEPIIKFQELIALKFEDKASEDGLYIIQLIGENHIETKRALRISNK